jgi:hypothetical protein
MSFCLVNVCFFFSGGGGGCGRDSLEGKLLPLLFFHLSIQMPALECKIQTMTPPPPRPPPPPPPPPLPAPGRRRAGGRAPCRTAARRGTGRTPAASPAGGPRRRRSRPARVVCGGGGIDDLLLLQQRGLRESGTCATPRAAPPKKHTPVSNLSRRPAAPCPLPPVPEGKGPVHTGDLVHRSAAAPARCSCPCPPSFV